MSTSVLRRGKAVSRYGLQRYHPEVRVVMPCLGAAQIGDSVQQALLLGNFGIVSDIPVGVIQRRLGVRDR